MVTEYRGHHRLACYRHRDTQVIGAAGFCPVTECVHLHGVVATTDDNPDVWMVTECRPPLPDLCMVTEYRCTATETRKSPFGARVDVVALPLSSIEWPCSQRPTEEVIVYRNHAGVHPAHIHIQTRTDAHIHIHNSSRILKGGIMFTRVTNS
ncbi:hypothetical protein HPB50_023881 [Hyalomma asiaticum]|uniref:Uncharacterized protein n=1 Tax=Hyalomma asiaticum TaxID=266040 RepID=A0ACB7S196_HYAAI|nr:hypothetical protein HPB50_023881 [Hyalomma asiaticum]